mmetsp:Transcript_10036/g.11470  ORF Transcript_10036/g.11470 Transcript_10036/m.11470 type:complete len:244 (-) Transcript_10036:30-761(-)
MMMMINSTTDRQQLQSSVKEAQQQQHQPQVTLHHHQQQQHPQQYPTATHRQGSPEVIMEELRIQSGCTVSNVNSHSNSSSRRRKRTRSTAAAAHYHVSALSSSSSKRRQRSDEGGGLMGILSLCHCQSPLVLPISSHGTFSLSSDNKHDSLFPSSSSSSSSSFPLPPLLHGTTTQWHRRGRSIPPHSTLCHLVYTVRFGVNVCTYVKNGDFAVEGSPPIIQHLISPDRSFIPSAVVCFMDTPH